MPSPLDIAKRQLTLTTHRIHTLPVVVLMPHSRCNCRCVMCDIWQANRNGHELSRDDLAAHLDDFRALNVRWVVLSGGEALMRPLDPDALRDVGSVMVTVSERKFRKNERICGMKIAANTRATRSMTMIVPDLPNM